MKGRAEVENAVRAFFTRHRLPSIAGVEAAWPQRVALGVPTKAELASHAHELARTIDELAKWAARAPVSLEYATRRVGGGLHEIPTHAVIANVDDAAILCGSTAKLELARARRRQDQLAASFELEPPIILKVLRAIDGWTETDFRLLMDASMWFATHDEVGMTSREVPLAGFSAKWLDSIGRRSLVELMIGRQLLLASRLRTVELAYLDPTYLSRGERRFDSCTEGDAFVLPYMPTCAIIVENRDTFLAFPEMEGGICVFGSGWAGTALARVIPWIGDIETLFYWGDIDADGYEILDAYRKSGLNVQSLFMDMPTYKRFEPFGTNEATGKTPLESRAEKPLANLTTEEREVYRLITSPDCNAHRRIEQERIPLTELFG